MNFWVKKPHLDDCENSLSPEIQQEKINELRKLIGPQSGKLAIYCSDACILRYLRARNWNVNKAVKMLKASLRWRLEFKPEDIRWNSKSIKGQMKYLVYCMENAILNLPEDQEQMVWLIDFHGFSMSNISIRATQETAHLLQDQYPERLGIAILYDPPKIFEPFWKVAKPFLEPKTANKVNFVYSDDSNANKIMKELFNMEVMESAFGGEDTADFEINKYAERMREDDEKIQSLHKKDDNLTATLPPAVIAPSSLDEQNSESESDVLRMKMMTSRSKNRGL